jgi:HSP20 family protein
MAIVRYSPVRDFDSLHGEMNRLFDGFFGNRTGERARGGGRWMPAMDLLERGDEFVLRADLPGVAMDDVSIEIQDGVMQVSGERKARHETEGESYYRAERAFGSFTRTLALPDGVEQDAVKASVADGVLEVRIPKPAERAPHKVAIEAASGADTAVEGEATEKS